MKFQLMIGALAALSLLAGEFGLSSEASAREEGMSDTPIAINAVSKEEIQRMVDQRFEDLMRQPTQDIPPTDFSNMPIRGLGQTTQSQQRVQQGGGEGFHGFDVQVVARFVENQNVVVTQQQPGHAHSCAFAAGQDADRLLHVSTSEQQGTGHVQAVLSCDAGHRVVFEVFQNGLVLRQRAVNVLSVRTDFETVAPLNFPFNRR